MGFIGLAIYSLLKSVCCRSTDVHPDVSALTHHRQIPAYSQHAWKGQVPTNRVDENELQRPKYTRARFPDVIFLFKFSFSVESLSTVSEPACAVFWANTKPAEDLISHCKLWKKNQTKPNKNHHHHHHQINPCRFWALQETGLSFNLLGILLGGKLAPAPFLIICHLKMTLL